MRKGLGIVLTALGAVGLSIYGIVLLPPLWRAAAVLFSPLGISGFHVHPVETPVSSAVLLIVGVPLLRKSRAAASK